MAAHIYICLLSVIIFTTSGFPLNLTLTDYNNPQANHFLDAEIVEDILIASAMVQGIEFYDISDPRQLNHLTNFNLGSGGGGGGGTKANCVRAQGDYAYFTSSNGLYVVNITDPSNPQSLGAISGTGNLNLENLDLHGNILAVAAHESGVKLFDISNPSSPAIVANISANNAWTAVLDEEYLYIADEDKILILDISNVNNPTQTESIETGNAVKDLAIANGFLYAALGSDGVNIYDIKSLQSPQFLDNFNTNTLANRIAPFDNKLAVSDWDDVEVLEWNGEFLNQVGYKNTGNRTMAIAANNNFVYSIEWASVQAFEFGQIADSDLDLSTWELNYPYVENGGSYSMTVDVINNGNETLITSDNYTTNSEFNIINPLSNLEPGESQTIEIIYNASNANASGAYRIYTNDPDEPEIICETNGNIDGANIGEPAPNFDLIYVGNGNGNFQLSDHLGEIIVIAFFSPM